jgi:hypothetical protein
MASRTCPQCYKQFSDSGFLVVGVLPGPIFEYRMCSEGCAGKWSDKRKAERLYGRDACELAFYPAVDDGKGGLRVMTREEYESGKGETVNG